MEDETATFVARRGKDEDGTGGWGVAEEGVGGGNGEGGGRAKEEGGEKVEERKIA